MIELGHDEKIVATARRHWLILFTETVPSAVLLCGVLIVPYAISAHPLLKFFAGLTAQIIVVLILVAAIDYALDVWVITDRRAIHAELNGFFRRIVSSVPHDKIQDITVTVPGFFATVFHYGDLQIQSAGAFQPTKMKTIPKPHRLKDVILAEKMKMSHGATHQESSP